MLRLLVLLAALILTAPAAADARMPRPSGVTVHWLQTRAQVEYECGKGAKACAGANEIWLLAGTGRVTIAHEYGHIYLDRAFANNQNARAKTRLLRLLGYRPDTAWSGTEEFYARQASGLPISEAPPEERAADAYAACATDTGPRWARRQGERVMVGRGTPYDYMPATPRKHARVCALLASVAV